MGLDFLLTNLVMRSFSYFIDVYVFVLGVFYNAFKSGYESELNLCDLIAHQFTACLIVVSLRKILDKSTVLYSVP